MHKQLLLFFFLIISSFLLAQKKNADSFLFTLKNIPDVETKFQRLHEHNKHYLIVYDHENQIQLLKQETEWAEQTKKKENILLLWGTKQRFYTHMFMVDSMQYFANQRVTLAQELKDSATIIDASLGLTYVYVYNEQYTKALSLLNTCYNWAKYKNDTIRYGIANTRFAVFYLRQGDYDKSAPYFRTAHKLLQYTNKLTTPSERRGAASFYSNYAEFFYEKKQWDSAVIFYKKSIKMAEGLISKTALLNSYNTLGKALGRQGKIEEATFFINKAFYLADSTQNFSMCGNIAIGFAELLHGINKSNEALEYCQKAKPLLDKDDYDTSDYRWLYLTMSQIYEKKGDYEKALFYQKRINLMTDTLHEKRNKDSLSAIQTRFEVKNKNSQIEQLDMSLKLKTQQRNGLIMGLLILFIAVVVAIWNYWQKQKANQLLLLKNEAISHQKDQLQQLNYAKDRLFSVVSHDLRSPLSHLYNVLQALHDTILPENDGFSLLKSAESKLHNALLLMDNLLLWSAGQFKGIQSKAQPFYISDALKEALFAVKELAENKQIEIENVIDEDLMGFADNNMLTTVFRNLLSNAIKFSPKGGKIHVSGYLKEGEEQLILAVADKGNGIPTAIQSTILEGKAGSSSGTNGEKGIGLGLNLCKSFVEANKGKLWFDSLEGIGTTFFVQIPAA